MSAGVVIYCRDRLTLAIPAPRGGFRCIDCGARVKVAA